LRKAFCERNLKPVFALLAALVAATIVWAVVSRQKKQPGHPGHGKVAVGSTSLTGRRGAVSTDPVDARPVRPGASATPSERFGQASLWTPARSIPGSPLADGQNLMVDATSMATPNGGIKMIRHQEARQPAMGSAIPNSPPRMRLVAAGPPLGGQNRSGLGALPPRVGAAKPCPSPGSLSVFNTVSSLILPCVVSIHATRNTRAPSPVLGGRDGAWIRFADPFDGVPEKFVTGKAYETVGSGSIIDTRGYVLTNHHVISQATDLLVGVAGKIKRDFPATVIAADPTADLALVKVSGAPALPEVRLGSSRSVQAGDWVLAFGSPFGLEQTVTQGIISSKRGSLVVGGIPYGDMLQTDAPTNRGSSGGPLVNLEAEVIGVNTAIYGPSGAFSGTGFAIPVDRANAFLAQCSRMLNR
jgi:serine protease Do